MTSKGVSVAPCLTRGLALWEQSNPASKAVKTGRRLARPRVKHGATRV
ncbi:MAG: hypothetical protein RIQ75_1060 [Pseudomonadota bacterium]|jgi:hypothetical protein